MLLPTIFYHISLSFFLPEFAVKIFAQKEVLKKTYVTLKLIRKTYGQTQNVLNLNDLSLDVHNVGYFSKPGS